MKVISNSNFHMCIIPKFYAIEIVWKDRIVLFIGYNDKSKLEVF